MKEKFIKRLIILFCLLLFFGGCSPVQGVRVVRGVFTHVRDSFERKETSKLYNPETPDTVENQKSFEWHLGVPVSEDVKNILAYADMFFEAKYLFSFQCDKAIIEHIIQENNLILDDNPQVNSYEFLSWWDEEDIETLPNYSNSDAMDEERRYRSLWYNKETQQAYYEEWEL